MTSRITRLITGVLAAVAASAFGPQEARAQSGSGLTLPGGYDSVVYRSGFPHQPTALAIDPQGRVTVSTVAGQIFTLIDANQDGVAESSTLFFSNMTGQLSTVTGILWSATKLYVCSDGKVTTMEDTDANGVADVVTNILTGLPTGFHQNNGLLFDGQNHLLITNGSATDIGPEASPLNAAVLRCELTGANLGVYATGLRNTYRLARHPVTGDVFGGDNEWNAHPSQSLAGDEINRIVAGGDYGYPSFFGAPPPASTTVAPVLMLPQHVAPTGLAFNPNTRISGYKDEVYMTLFTQGASAVLIRVPILYGPASGQPAGFTESFASGFINPIDVAFMPDGSMLVADFSAKKVHRIFPKSDAALTIEAPPVIGSYCPIRLRSPFHPGAVVYMGASVAPQPAVVLGSNVTVYLDTSSPVFTLSVTPNNGYFNFPIPGNLDAAGEHVAGIAIPALPSLAGLDVWLSYVVLDAANAPVAASPAQALKVLPVF